MPVNKHLQWFEIVDFTPGLHESAGVSPFTSQRTGAKQQFAGSASAFTEMLDYQPMKEGGIRAFHKATVVGHSGIGANEACMGIYVLNGVHRDTGVGGSGTDTFIALAVTISTSDFKMRIYRMDNTVAAPPGTWSLIFTGTAASSPGHQVACFEFFKRATDLGLNKSYTLITIAGGALTDWGLYNVGFDGTVASGAGIDGVATKLQSFSGPLIVSQARVMVGTGNDEILHYSDVGDMTFASVATQRVGVAPNRGQPNISMLSGFEPSEVLVGKEGAPWVSISGDITLTSTPIREMGDTAHQRQNKQQIPRVPGGIAFIEGSGRVYITDGRTFRSISDQLHRFALNFDAGAGTGGMVGTGTMAYLNGLLFAPGGSASGLKGLVYDFDSGAWFHQSSLNGVFYWADVYSGEVWAAAYPKPSFEVSKFSVFGGMTTRAPLGIVQTQPFADKNGRNVNIREVQLFVQNYTASTYTVELIDKDGTSVVTRTVGSITGRQMASVQFPNTKSEYLSVKITAEADDGTSEAPTIERIRIGFGLNNLIS
jgi:hypothetical protein